jgi:hypothetical protein
VTLQQVKSLPIDTVLDKDLKEAKAYLVRLKDQIIQNEIASEPVSKP